MERVRYLSGLMAALAAGSACAADLSPDHWPVAIRADVERKEVFRYPPYGRTVEGDHGLMAGTLSPIAIHAGSEALREGGSAADAAATAALTQIATGAGGPVTYAGVFQLLYFDARTKKVYALDAQWGRYAHETDPATIPDSSRVAGAAQPTLPANEPLGRDTLVPGFMAGVEAMHARFGRLPFADLFQPAIWYADHGFVVSPILGSEFERQQAVLWRTPEGRRFASMPDGRLPIAGDLFRQPEAAKTLRAVASQGAAYMYTGDWAHAYVAAVQAAGGKATLDDLARYRALWREPYSLPFEGAALYSIGENEVGGCPSLEALNILSAAKVDEMGPYWRDPRAFGMYVRAIRFAFYGHFPGFASPQQDHPASSTCAVSLTPQYAKAAMPKIEAAGTAPNPDVEPGHHTDAVVAVDRWGDVAVLVHSSNTVGWGVTGLVVDGVPIPDKAGFASTKAALATGNPNAQLPSGMGPVIGLRDGKPVVAVAGIGFGLVPETVRLLGGLLASGEDLRTVMAAPELLLSSDPIQSDWNWPEQVPAGAYDPELLKAVEAQGLPTKAVPPENDGRGLAAVVVLDQTHGSAKAVEAPNLAIFAEADPRSLAPPPPLATPGALDRYVGVFKVARKVVRVKRDGAYLTAKVPGVPFLLPLSAAGDQEFVGESVNVRVTFDPAINGVSNGLVFHSNGVDSRGVRISESEAAQSEAADTRK
jgi:gamma-glutamyltranspeptidase / glutathione hydrolase